jgi:hypothetical protein
MRTVFFMMMSLAILLACEKDDNLAENYQDHSLTWSIGADYSIDTTVVLPVSSTANNYLKIESYSICPNQDLKITVSGDGQILLDTTYHEGDSKYTIPDSKGKQLSVHSRLEANDSLIMCVWLGQATLKYDYVE